jgi:hypothetical protein
MWPQTTQNQPRFLSPVTKRRSVFNLPSGKPELVIWLALWAVGTVLAAEDRWLVEHAWLDPKCPYESTGGPRR